MEHILAFGLGIMLVSTMVLAYMVVESNKRVNELNSLQQDINDLHRSDEDIVNSIYTELEKIDRKIDSRVDKLYDVSSKEIEEANRKIDFLRRSLGKEY